MEKIIIAGSRSVPGVHVVEAAMAAALAAWNIQVDEVVSGTARGADRAGELWAQQRGIKVALFPADWDRYGKRAGYLRNEQMATYGTRLVACWDGVSKGTQHMINIMRGLNKPVYIHRFDLPDLLPF